MNITESLQWADAIYQIARTDKVEAGTGGVANLQAEQLAARTQFLRIMIEGFSDYREYTFFMSDSDPDGTIAGLAGTPEGKLFRVARGVGGAVSFDIYLNNAGVAQKVAEMAGQESIRNNIRQYEDEAAAQRDVIAGNIPNGAHCRVRNEADDFLDDEYVNDEGQLLATGKKTPSAHLVSLLLNSMTAANNLYFDPLNEYARSNPTLGNKTHFSGTVLTSGHHSPFGFPSIGNGNLSFSGKRIYLADNHLSAGQTVVIESCTWHENPLGRLAYFFRDAADAVIGSAVYQYLTTENGNQKRSQALTIPAGTNCIEFRADYATGGAGATEICSLSAFTAEGKGIYYRPALPYALPAGTDSVSTTAIKDRAVTPAKVSFIRPVKNMFDKSAVTVGAYVDSTSGILKANATYDTSDFIYVTPGSQVSANNAHQWAWYDENKIYLSGIAAATPNTGNRTVTVPAGAYWLRTTIAASLVNTFQVEAGSAVTAYESFSTKMDPELVPSMAPKDKSVTAEKLADGAVTPEKTADIFDKKVSKNLFDKNAVVAGYINPPTGNVAANSSYSASDFIPVTAGETYTQSPYRHTRAFYNANKTFISGVAAETPYTSNLTWAAPAGAAYVRLSVGVNYVDLFQLEKGSEATTYEAYYEPSLKLKEKYLSDGGDAGAEVEAARGETDSLDARLTPTIDVNGMATGGRFQPEFLSMTRYKLRKIKRSDSGGPYQYTLAIPGDSYTHSAPRYTQALATDLRAEYGDAGAGWVGFGFPSTDELAGDGTYPNQNGNENKARMALTYSGNWSGIYASGNSPDICACHSANAGDKITVSWLVAAATSSLRLLAKGGSGVVRWRYSNNGSAFGVWTTLDLSPQSGLSVTELAGYGATKWALEIEVVSGDPMLYGLDHQLSTAGVRVHKLGASGSRAQHWTNADAAEWSAALTALNPDCVAIFLAPNDQKVYGPDVYKTHIQIMIDRARSAVPQADILLVVAPSNGTDNEALRPMPGYARAAYQLAHENNCAAMSLQRYFGPDYSSYGYGTPKNWFASDHLHPDALTGGRVILDAFYRLLTQG